MHIAAPKASDPPWTTGRCNRLLRPLTAQLKVLREIVYPQLGTTVSTGQASTSGLVPAPSSKFESKEEDEIHHVGRRKSFDDPDWIPSGPDKRGTKRLYTNRSVKANPNSAPGVRKPGEISMPTPLIARQVMLDDSSQPKAKQATGWQFLQTPKKRRFPLLRHDRSSALLRESVGAQLRHVERFLQAFRSLLHATQPGDLPGEPKTGTRSLMSTCLRRIPAYIEGRQQWEDEENAEKIDASEQVYQELEGMGAASGWRPLREVVRAHGVALVTVAVSEKLLDTIHIEQLIRQCYDLLAFDEAEEIISAFAFATAPLPPPRTTKDELIQFDDPRFRGIATAHAWADRTDGWSFFYRLVRKLLLCGLLPIEWASTAKFKQIWSRIIRNISDSNSAAHSEACKLFHAVTSIACGINPMGISDTLSDEADNNQSTKTPPSVSKALTTTVSSLSVIFAAIFLLPNEEASYGQGGKYAIQHALESVASEVTRYILEGNLNSMLARSSCAIERLSNIITCSIIAGVKGGTRLPHSASSPITMHIRGLTQVEETTERQLLNIPAIVCSVAETCGKAYAPKSPENVFQVLKSIVLDLKSYRISSMDDGDFTESTLSNDWETVGFPSWFLKRLALDSANEFADHSQDFIGTSRDCFEFALKIENEMQKIQMPHYDTPFFYKDADYHVGYRWESGISEWVEATPFVTHTSKLVPPLPPPPGEEEEDEQEPPSSPLKVSTPARPTLSQLLLANSTPDVLSQTPVAAVFSTPTTATPVSTTPAFSSTPVALEHFRKKYDIDDCFAADETEDDAEEDGEDDVDELALTSPVQQPQPPPPSSSPERPPRKRVRKSGGCGERRVPQSRPAKMTLSTVFGLDGPDDSGDELGFL